MGGEFSPAPRGDYITVSGKLDPHATVYGFDRILKAIETKNFEGKDRYGIPILKYDAVVAGKVELGAPRVAFGPVRRGVRARAS